LARTNLPVGRTNPPCKFQYPLHSGRFSLKRHGKDNALGSSFLATLDESSRIEAPGRHGRRARKRSFGGTERDGTDETRLGSSHLMVCDWIHFTAAGAKYLVGRIAPDIIGSD
jgi:hypothetical protein